MTFRIEEVRKATVNGRAVKLFKVFTKQDRDGAYVFTGQFSAPANTPDNRLVEVYLNAGDDNAEPNAF